MTVRVLAVHGIGNRKLHKETGDADAAAAALAAVWHEALGNDEDLRVEGAYYAHLLHRGTAQGAEDPANLESGAQADLVAWVEALQPVPAVPQGPLTYRARQAAEWLTRHFGTAVARSAVLFCREVHTYLSAPQAPRRIKARDAVAAAIERHRPDVVVAHSLGSVVAYEALWASGAEVPRLVTLGSPLAMAGVVFDRLDPAPAERRGDRPPGVLRWLNVADVGDVVAVPRGGLAPWFGGVEDRPDVVVGRLDFHTATAYLRVPEVRELLTP